MRLIVYGGTYTGARSRGLADPADNRWVMMLLEGTERNIVDYLLENFSYGAQENITTVSDLARGISDRSVTMFEGCGGLLRLMQENGKIIFHDEDVASSTPLEWVDLATINVDKLDQDDFYNHVDNLLRNMPEAPDEPTAGNDMYPFGILGMLVVPASHDKKVNKKMKKAINQVVKKCKKWHKQSC
jgi:hypothetical protein